MSKTTKVRCMSIEDLQELISEVEAGHTYVTNPDNDGITEADSDGTGDV
jgi:hypothetical protein